MLAHRSRPFTLPALTLLTWFGTAAPAMGQQPRLLEDINTKANSSNARQFAGIGSLTLFVAEEHLVDPALFASNGTAAGTRNLGSTSTYKYPSNLTSLGSSVIYGAHDGQSRRLMVTDGKPKAGRPLAAAAQFADPRHLVRFGNRVVFSAMVGGLGNEPCITDGTTAGTKLLKDIEPGPGSSDARGFLSLGKTLYFAAKLSNTSVELWRSDGTSTGTNRVITLSAQRGGLQPLLLEPMDARRLVIVHHDNIYLSDGTAAGTRKIGQGQLAGATTQAVYYTVDTGRLTADLWKNDGSGKASVRIAPSLRADGESAALGTTLIFSMSPLATLNRRQLWRTDGTAAGTFKLADAMFGLREFRGRVYFANRPTGAGDSELWVTNGTLAGTGQLLDIHPTGSSEPRGLTVVGTRLWFSAANAAGREPWSTDGTGAGTRMVKDINSSTHPSMTPFVGGFTDVYGEPHFITADPVGLWRTDGSTGGTRQLAAFPIGAASGPAVSALGQLFCPMSGDLWRYDDPPLGPTRLARVSLQAAIELDDAVLFRGRGFVSSVPNDGLWRTDGTPAGTWAINIPGIVNSRPRGFMRIPGGAAFFTQRLRGNGPDYIPELWRSDGTQTGTSRILAGQAGQVVFGNPEPMGVGRYLFVAHTSKQHLLWSTDGSIAGTHLIKTLAVAVPELTVLAGGSNRGGFLFVQQQNRTELWFTDGTATGTILLQQGPGGFDGPSSLATALGDRLVYRFGTAKAGQELHVSDGTVAGTGLLKDLAPGVDSSSPHRFLRVGSRYVYFVADTPKSLWRTDGTASGTIRLGNRPVSSGKLTVSGGKLYFVGDDPRYGMEPMVLDLDACSWSISRGCGEHGNAILSATDPVVGSAMRLRLQGAVPSRAGMLLIGERVMSFRSAPRLADGCLVLVDLGGPTFNFPLRTDARGDASLGLGIPNIASLIGLQLVAQTVIGPTAAPRGIDLSGTVQLSLGN